MADKAKRPITTQITDAIKIRLYKEFYEKNKELFRKDPQEYWAMCTRYFEEHYRERLNDYLNGKETKGLLGKIFRKKK